MARLLKVLMTGSASGAQPLGAAFTTTSPCTATGFQTTHMTSLVNFVLYVIRYDAFSILDTISSYLSSVSLTLIARRAEALRKKPRTTYYSESRPSQQLFRPDNASIDYLLDAARVY